MVLMKNQNSKFKIQKLGFTLIEMLVAMATFSIIIIVAIGLFTSSIKSQRQILARQQVLDQTSYALEYISRAMRMAKKDDITIGGITVNCLAGDKANYEITHSNQGIKFRTYDNECWEFYLENGQLKQTVTNSSNNYSAMPLTSNGLTVNNFKIVSSGWDQSDSLQPAVTLLLDITGQQNNNIKIQTTISQRNLDVQY